MIWIDDRSGSAELQPLFPPSVTTEVTRLDYGDFSFIGNGPEGPVLVGVERKTIRDLVNSIVTGRLSGHQLIGLTETYQYTYLLVEGIWSVDRTTGILEVRGRGGWVPLELGSRRFMAKEIHAFLNSLAIKCDVRVIQTGGTVESAYLITSLYQWWQKEWDAHTSHMMRHKTTKGAEGTVELVRASLVRRVAAELPGIGWGKSKEVDRAFPNLERLVLATIDQWRTIPGIGRTIAHRIYNEIRGLK